MNKPSLIPLMILLAVPALGVSPSVAAGPAAAEERPNIILCMADDQGWGDVGYNGHPELKTPTLDAMAATGLCFHRFYAAAPVCSPTRGSVLTGRHPNRFACFTWGRVLRPEEVTVAELLQTAGYATGHFGKWHLGSVRADSPLAPGAQGFEEWFSAPNFFDLSPKMSHRGKVVQTEGESSQVVVDAALEFIRDCAKRKQPFLAVVWFGSPHSPHLATAEDRALYKDLPAKLQHYLGEITAMDRSIGHLRRQLRALGIADNTLLWYTSDNGAAPPGSTGGLAGKKGTLWEGGIRVPAILEWPARIRSPRSTDVPCGTVDILPTVLELVGRKAPRRPLDGISLVPLLEGCMSERPKPLGFWVYPAAGVPTRSEQILTRMAAGENADPQVPPEPEQYSAASLPGHAAWIDNRYKLHRLPTRSDEVQYKLFDLVDDPKETNDLASSQPGRVERMKAELEAWQQSVIRSLNREDYRQP